MSWERRILVLEDEPLVASLICDVLNQQGFRASASANAMDARSKVDETDPDAALIDINLGSGPNGIQFGQWLHRAHPHIALVFLTKHLTPTDTTGGTWQVPPGSSFLSKQRLTDSRSLLIAIEAALREHQAPTRHDLDNQHAITSLTPTQMEILRLAAQGMTNSAIAARRGTTERTVEQRLAAVYETLGIQSTPLINARVQAIRMLIESGAIIDDPEPSP